MLRALLHRELDILIVAMEKFEGDTVCYPTLKLQSEKIMDNESDQFETYACVTYESEIARKANGKYELDERYMVNKLYELVAVGEGKDVPYATEITEIMDSGDNGGCMNCVICHTPAIVHEKRICPECMEKVKSHYSVLNSYINRK